MGGGVYHLTPDLIFASRSVYLFEYFCYNLKISQLSPHLFCIFLTLLNNGFQLRVSETLTKSIHFPVSFYIYRQLLIKEPNRRLSLLTTSTEVTLVSNVLWINCCGTRTIKTHDTNGLWNRETGKSVNRGLPATIMAMNAHQRTCC